MIVLAIAPDSKSAAAVQYIVCDRLCAEIEIVQSVDLAVEALGLNAPDVVLLPALVSPAEEARFLESLRQQPNCAHVEVLVAPVFETSANPPAPTPRGWLQWGSRPTPTGTSSGDEARLFAERLGWSLQRVRQRKHVAAQECAVLDNPETRSAEPVEAVEVVDAAEELLIDLDELSELLAEPAGTPPVESGPSDAPVASVCRRPDEDRRTFTRFLGSHLKGLRAARLEMGPEVELLDISAGGALIETEAEMPADSEDVLELVGDQGHTLVPFRVVRSEAADGDAARYRQACAFMRPLDLADLLQLPAFDDALGILERHLPSLRRAQLEELLGRLRSRQEPSSPLEREALDLLNIALSASHQNPAGVEASGDPSERRRHVRVEGPIDGLRLGALETPVVIRDLSEGGCFVGSLVDAKPGRQLSIGILVPGEDWITATGEVVRGQPGFGFALRFVGLPEATRATLTRFVAARKKSAPDVTVLQPA